MGRGSGGRPPSRGLGLLMA